MFKLLPAGLLLSTLAAASDTSVLSAQIPSGHGLGFRMFSKNVGLTQPLEGGYVQEIVMPWNVHTGEVDPVAGDLYWLRWELTYFELYRTSFEGLEPVDTEHLGEVTDATLVFDANGNVIVGTTPPLRWERSTNTFSPFGGDPDFLLGDLAVDPETNELWTCSFGPGNTSALYRLDLNDPDAEFESVMAIDTPGAITLSDFELDEGRFVISTRFTGLGLDVWELIVPTETVHRLFVPYVASRFEFDAANDHVHFPSTPYNVHELTSGARVTSFSPGGGHDLALSNFGDTLQVFPRFPDANEPFRLEAAVWGEEGDPALIWWRGEAPGAAALIASGVCGSGGVFTWSAEIPAGWLGRDKTWRLTGARQDSVGRWRVTEPVSIRGL